MNEHTYIQAADMELRLYHGRLALEQEYPENNWRRAAVMIGFDTAIDCATCYRDEGGDIWYKPEDDCPEGEDLILAVMVKPGVVVAAPGYKEDGVFHIFSTVYEDGCGQVVAWAFMPAVPNPMDMISEGDVCDGHDQS